MSGAERIQINPASKDIPERGWYVAVEGPNQFGMVEVAHVETAEGMASRVKPITMHADHWLALVDWFQKRRARFQEPEGE